MKSFWFVALLSLVLAGIVVYFYGGISKDAVIESVNTKTQRVLDFLLANGDLAKTTDGSYKSISIKNIPIKAEIVTTEAAREKGLMHRDSLEDNAGMLFVFPEYGYHAFWMKNTRIPLDIIWFDRNQKIIYIEKNAQPCLDIKCPTYKPTAPAIYVLEMVGGWTDEHNVFVGDPANLNY